MRFAVDAEDLYRSVPPKPVHPDEIPRLPITIGLPEFGGDSGTEPGPIGGRLGRLLHRLIAAWRRRIA